MSSRFSTLAANLEQVLNLGCTNVGPDTLGFRSVEVGHTVFFFFKELLFALTVVRMCSTCGASAVFCTGFTFLLLLHLATARAPTPPQKHSAGTGVKHEEAEGLLRNEISKCSLKCYYAGALQTKDRQSCLQSIVNILKTT